MKPHSQVIRGGLLLAFILGAPGLVQAHHAEFMLDRPMLQGLSMPVHGLDHMMVTIAVGLIAAQLGGRALWALPGIFTLSILAGGVLNLLGVPVPLVEWAILASIVVCGGMLAWGSRMSLLLTGVVLALFAMCHGNALIANDGFVHNLPIFITGCLISALVLQGAGLALGLGLKRLSQVNLYRYAGFALLAGAVVVGFFPSVNDFMINVIEGAGH